MTPDSIKKEAEQEVADEQRRALIEAEKIRLRHQLNTGKKSLFPWRMRLQRKPECEPICPVDLREILKSCGWRLRWKFTNELEGTYYVERDQ